MLIVWPLAGGGEYSDYQASAGINALVSPWIVSGFSVVPGSISAGKALLRAVRANGQETIVLCENTQSMTLDTSGTKKIWIKLAQNALDDGSQNAPDGSGVASIQSGASYPSTNFLPLASISSGVITDERVMVGLSGLRRRALGSWKVLHTDAAGTEQEIALGASGTALMSNGTSAAPSFQVPTAPRITGEIIAWPTPWAPSGWLPCDGSAVSRTTYASLFNALNPGISNPTITIASPGVVTSAGHGLQNGTPIFLATTGALPTGLSVNTTYYVVNTTTNNFQLAATVGGAAINTTGSQSGTHSLFLTPWGNGNGTTTFNVPNFKGRSLVGFDSSQTEFNILGKAGGEKTHVMTTAEMPAHTHTFAMGNGLPGSSAGMPALAGSSGGGTATTNSNGSGSAFNVLSPFATAHYIIKA